MTHNSKERANTTTAVQIKLKTVNNEEVICMIYSCQSPTFSTTEISTKLIDPDTI